MEVQIFCCSVVDYVATGEWVQISTQGYDVEVTFVDQQGGKKTVVMMSGDLVKVPFVGLQLRSKGDNQTIYIRTGWGDIEPSPALGLGPMLADMMGAMGGPPVDQMCVDVASPVQTLERQTKYMWTTDVEVPANSTATIDLEAAKYYQDYKISKVLIQNASATFTRCRVKESGNGGLWVIGGGSSIGQSNWFDAGEINTLIASNESSEPALITVSALLYKDEGNACRNRPPIIQM